MLAYLNKMFHDNNIITVWINCENAQVLKIVYSTIRHYEISSTCTDVMRSWSLPCVRLQHWIPSIGFLFVITKTAAAFRLVLSKATLNINAMSYFALLILQNMSAICYMFIAQ